MQNSQDMFKIRKQPFISAFSIYMTVPLRLIYMNFVTAAGSPATVYSL